MLVSSVTPVPLQAESEDLIQEVEELSREFEGTATREATLLGQLREKVNEGRVCRTWTRVYHVALMVQDAQLAKLAAETARHRLVVLLARGVAAGMSAMLTRAIMHAACRPISRG